MTSSRPSSPHNTARDRDVVREDTGDSESRETEVEYLFTPQSGMAHPFRAFANSLHDLWSGRELAWRMFVRNLQGLYRQTLLGLFWAFLPPLANTLVWLLLRQAGAIDLAGDMEVNYAVYVVTGMVIWQSFVEALQAPLNAVNANRNMLSKIRFPRESVLLVSIYELVFNLGIRLVVLIPLLVFFGSGATPWLLAGPLLVLPLIVLGLGMGLLLMPFGMLYQDIGKLLGVIIPVWMIVTPIVYAAPDGWNTNPLNWLNPASPLLTLARDLLVFGESSVGLSAAVYAIVALPLAACGLLFYRMSIPVLVERISS